MSNALSTALSGLIAFQRATEMTGHNIANVNTPGYSRQVADFVTRDAHGTPVGFIGTGTEIATIRRVYDNILGSQLADSQSSHARFEALSDLASRLDGLLADPGTGLNAQLGTFFNSVQDVANDPASLPTRQALLGEADALVLRFTEVDRQLDALDSEVTQRIRAAVADINQLATAIADVNEKIALAQGRTGQPPNDLLDQRDSLLRNLAGLVSVNAVTQDDGTMNVFIGSGQNLVTGIQARGLATRPDEFDPTRVAITFEGASGTLSLGSAMTGGQVGGLLEFRDRMLDSARQTLGATAQALALTFNDQHASGLDLYGNLGGGFFGVADPAVLTSGNNTGSGTATATIADLGAVAGGEYLLEFDGANYSLRDTASGQPIAMSGSGTAGDPFLAGGLAIVTGGSPAAGDRLLIRPAADSAGTLNRQIVDPQAIAMAAPTRSSADLANLGNADISATTVVDRDDPNLLSTATIEFLSPGAYSIDGAGSFAFTSGTAIVVNGSEFTITGTPVAGDTFTVEANTGATGDNRNGLALANVQAVGILDGGTVSINESYGQLVGNVGSATRQAQTNFAAQQVVLANAESAVASRSGVNLDEEAANLIRYQQAYQAAAQVINVASTLFDTLLSATRR